MRTEKKTAAPTIEEIDAAKGLQSRYGWLKATYGEKYADRYMRGLEVASWDIRVK